MAAPRKTRKAVRSSSSGRITEEDVDKKGGIIPHGKGHWVRKELQALLVGELLFVHKTDWNWVGKGNGPARIVTSLNKRGPRSYSIGLTGDQSGWVIKRLE